jgi:hypothetical protein
MNNKKVYKGEWCISSSTPCRKERLKTHKEFEASDLKRMLDRDWELKAVRPKRPRIQHQGFKVIITCFGPMKITIEEYNQHCKDFKTL